MMNEISFEIRGVICVSDEALDDYKANDDEFDLIELVSDSVSLDETGEFTVTDAYFG
ncbi:MAG: hypothetical protein HFJ74_00895 [Eggerthellaceae bacterium]|jgi:hypothetical protein|nr:hypothetical protein [Eggerthellaceae bacterium]